MKRLGLIVAVVLLSGVEVEACGRKRACHGHHRKVACPPLPMGIPATVAQSAPVASSPGYQGLPVTLERPIAPPPMTPAVSPSAGVQPTYNYAAADGSRPAYYYTYDNSGRLIVGQWVDYLFRGGRAEGMPRPPLPVIGALRNRN